MSRPPWSLVPVAGGRPQRLRAMCSDRGARTPVRRRARPLQWCSSPSGRRSDAVHRLPVVYLATLSAACDVAGVVTGPPEAPDEPVSRRLSVSLSLAAGQASVIGMSPVLDPVIALPRPGARVLDYELVGDDGQVLA